jgi:hypothetical protein
MDGRNVLVDLGLLIKTKVREGEKAKNGWMTIVCDGPGVGEAPNREINGK